MRPVPLIDKCKTELKMSHRWFAVYFHYSSTYSRPFRVLSLWMNIVIMLFIQSITYNLADPDDGSCEKQHTMEDCLKLKSSLSNSNECDWNVESEKCSFRPINHDFDRVLIVAVLSGIMSAPFSILFQSLILFVLSAKTRVVSRDRRLSSQVSGISMNRRRGLQNQVSDRLSGVENDLKGMRVGKKEKEFMEVFTMDSLPTTIAEDLGLLLKKLREYKSDLNEVEKEEFECELNLSFILLFYFHSYFLFI